MKKTRFLWLVVLVLALILAGCGGTEPPPAGDPDPEPVDVGELFDKGRTIEHIYYEYSVTGVDGMDEMEFEGKAWISNNKMKMEMSAAGQVGIIIIDGEAETAYMYMPAENMAIRMPFSEGEEESPETPLDFLYYDESLIDVGETEIINGVECLKITVEDEYPITMWLHKEYGIPMRVEAIIGDQTMVWEFRNISTQPIPDEVFTLPEGVNIINP